MEALIQGAGIFIYPLGICSLLFLMIVSERLYALRLAAVMPKGLLLSILKGQVLDSHVLKQSVAGRIADFFFEYQPDAESLKAYAEVELTKLERGFFILEVIIAGAPLLGLLGTVTGLVNVFAHYNMTGGSADTSIFVEGIALALTTTMLGLIIALPTLVAHSYLMRRVELFSVDIGLQVERLLQVRYQKA